MSDYKRLTESGDYYTTNDNEHDIIVRLDKERYEEPQYDYDDICKKLNRLAELEDKIEQGKLVELPCKVGDKVWYIKSYGFGRYQVEDMVVAGFNFSRFEDTIWVVGLYEEQSSHIYLTKEQAEARLKELQK